MYTSINKKLEKVQKRGTEVKMIMPEKVLNQIKYLCSSISAVEWSGVLFYSIKGSIQNPKDMVITLEEILPMHKGTQAYTEYELGEEVVDFMMENETMEKGWIMGHIHSHNNMEVFFSGTDMSELEDNAPNHNFYTSLIVNNRMDFCAKVCFIAESTDTYKYNFYSKNEKGEKYVSSSMDYDIKDKQLIIYDCDIETPNTTISVKDSFRDRVQTIIKEAEPVTRTPYTYGGGARVHQTSPTIGGFQNKTQRKEVNGFTENFQKSLLQNPGEDLKEEEEDLEMEAIEQFASYIINVGHPSIGDIEDTIQFHIANGVTGKMLANKVVLKYPDMYDTFFTNTPAHKDNDSFIDITELVTEELKEQTFMSAVKGTRGLLQPVILGLELMVNKFKNIKE